MNNKYMQSYSFEFYLKIYPITFLNRSDLEKGDKVLLPSIVLQKLSASDIKGPIIFELTNTNSKKVSHCGVMDFTADEGCAYLPRWMIENLGINEGEILRFNYASLEKGNYVRLQPQSDDFLEISNPKAVLEAKLRYFTCLTKSDIIAIEYNNKIYWINILEVKPGIAISIIDTDIDVDFAIPVINKKINTQNLINEDGLKDVGVESSEIQIHSDDSSSIEKEGTGKSFGGKGHFNK